LVSIFEPKTSDANTEALAQLHEELKISLNAAAGDSSRYESYNGNDLNENCKNIKEGWAKHKLRNKKGLQLYYAIGKSLENLKSIYKSSRCVDSAKGWEAFVQEKTGISKSHARNLKAVSKLLSVFPPLQQVTISFSDIIKKKKKIQNMLLIEKYSTFWLKTKTA